MNFTPDLLMSDATMLVVVSIVAAIILIGSIFALARLTKFKTLFISAPITALIIGIFALGAFTQKNDDSNQGDLEQALASHYGVSITIDERVNFNKDRAEFQVTVNGDSPCSLRKSIDEYDILCAVPLTELSPAEVPGK